MQSVLHSLDYRCSEPDFLFAMLKIRTIICQQYQQQSNVTNTVDVPNSIPNDLPPTGVFAQSAIENHLKSEEKREIFKSEESPALTFLDANRIREILGK